MEQPSKFAIPVTDEASLGAVTQRRYDVPQSKQAPVDVHAFLKALSRRHGLLRAFRPGEINQVELGYHVTPSERQALRKETDEQSESQDYLQTYWLFFLHIWIVTVKMA